ncbi:hypothetical protein L1987_67952 [Smallanthus sonchifolius]|uniref:Uncharacterized protein n=1 Tax=Smallanthus sonchifolius TaxID=185202 RepID=A0ACB9B2U9_9ASTR|nr:hypothetical protein L1987_67952 [Smallanthus sonchifolius]
MESELSQFLGAFRKPLHHRKPESRGKSWVFWSGSENNSSSADLANPIHHKIISALSNTNIYPWMMCQFWAPVTIGGRRLLSTSGQPFAVSSLSNELAVYRKNCEKYEYNIDADKIDNGGPATAFLNRFPCLYDRQRIPDCKGMGLSVMLPICFPSQSDCIGVLEFTIDMGDSYYVHFVLETIKELKVAGLNVFSAQDRIPYKNRL